MTQDETLIIQPRDPVIFRDGKPFSTGLPGNTLSFAPPSVVAGSVRTRLGQTHGVFDKSRISELKDIELSGPFLGYRLPDESQWSLAFPSPADASPFHNILTGLDEWNKLRPRDSRPAQSNIPDGMLPLFGGSQSKPRTEALAFWNSQSMSYWLEGKTPCRLQKNVGFSAPTRNRRVHARIDRTTQAAEVSMLYSTEGLEFVQTNQQRRVEFEFALAARVSTGLPRTSGLSHIGGETRAAYYHWGADVNWPQPPSYLNDCKRIRLVLATPAIFSAGWKPKWLDDKNEGCPPNTSGSTNPSELKLKLCAAAVNRPLPLSGWDYEINSPKPTRLMAPAGSVYFFEVLQGDPTSLWLKSICDNTQDRLDGFGRVLVGKGDW